MVWTIIMCMCRTDSPHDEDISPSSPRFRKSEGALLPVHNSAERNDSLAIPVSPQLEALSGARRSPSNASHRNFWDEGTDNLDALPEPVQNGPISIHSREEKPPSPTDVVAPSVPTIQIASPSHPAPQVTPLPGVEDKRPASRSSFHSGVLNGEAVKSHPEEKAPSRPGSRSHQHHHHHHHKHNNHQHKHHHRAASEGNPASDEERNHKRKHRHHHHHHRHRRHTPVSEKDETTDSGLRRSRSSDGGGIKPATIPSHLLDPENRRRIARKMARDRATWVYYFAEQEQISDGDSLCLSLQSAPPATNSRLKVLDPNIDRFQVKIQDGDSKSDLSQLETSSVVSGRTTSV